MDVTTYQTFAQEEQMENASPRLAVFWMHNGLHRVLLTAGKLVELFKFTSSGTRWTWLWCLMRRKLDPSSHSYYRSQEHGAGRDPIAEALASQSVVRRMSLLIALVRLDLHIEKRLAVYTGLTVGKASCGTASTNHTMREPRPVLLSNIFKWQCFISMNDQPVSSEHLGIRE